MTPQPAINLATNAPFGMSGQLSGLPSAAAVRARCLGSDRCFAQGTDPSVGSVVSLDVLAYLGLRGASRNRSSVSQVGLRIAPGFPGLPAQGLGQTALAAGGAVVTFAVRTSPNTPT